MLIRNVVVFLLLLNLVQSCRTSNGSQVKEFALVKSMNHNADGTWTIACADSQGSVEAGLSDREVQEELFCFKNRTFLDFCENSRSVYNQNGIAILKSSLGARDCAQLDAMRGLDIIELIDLYSEKIISLNFLVYFPSVKTFAITNRSVRSYLALSRLPKLERLQVSVSSALDAADLKYTTLKYLEINANSLTNEHELASQTQLSELSLYDVSPLGGIDFVSHLQSLKKFDLSYSYPIEKAISFGALQNLTQLQELNLVGLDVKNLNELNLSNFNRLKALNLSRNGLTSLNSIKGPHIEELDVQKNPLQSLHGIETLISLKTLKVDETVALRQDIKDLRARGVQVNP